MNSSHIWLVSFPGSGNTFARYTLEAMYHRATLTTAGDDDSISSVIDMSVRRHGVARESAIEWLEEEKGFNVDAYGEIDFYKHPVAIKSHSMNNADYEYEQNVYLGESNNLSVNKGEWSDKSPVIFILRDPYEVVAGRISKRPRTGRVKKTAKRELLDVDLPGYLHLLKSFDEHQGDKLLIRYETLMRNTALIDSLIKICSFISNNHSKKSEDEVYDSDDINEKVIRFMKKIKIHKENSSISYKRTDMRSFDDITYWRRFWPEELADIDPNMNRIHEICKDFDSDLYSRYLQVYEKIDADNLMR